MRIYALVFFFILDSLSLNSVLGPFASPRGHSFVFDGWAKYSPCSFISPQDIIFIGYFAPVAYVSYRTSLLYVCKYTLQFTHAYRSLTVPVQIFNMIGDSRLYNLGNIMFEISVQRNSSPCARRLLRTELRVICAFSYYHPFTFFLVHYCFDLSRFLSSIIDGVTCPWSYFP